MEETLLSTIILHSGKLNGLCGCMLFLGRGSRFAFVLAYLALRNRVSVENVKVADVCSTNNWLMDCCVCGLDSSAL